MAISEKAKAYQNKMHPGESFSLLETDPEFVELFANFAFDEVLSEEAQQLEPRTRFLALLAIFLGSQGLDDFKTTVEAALNFGLTPVEIKEVVYQSVAYLGISRVTPFLKATNEIFTKNGISLPLEGQRTNTDETRYESGQAKQVELLGPMMEGFGKSGPEESRHINRWLVTNCFGDYYTRNGLEGKDRELITFCFLYAQGGCEPQALSHATANIRLGNDKAFLIKVISNGIPYIGYPRTLNALRIINEADKIVNQTAQDVERQL